jgi:hypothetical protein
MPLAEQDEAEGGADGRLIVSHQNVEPAWRRSALHRSQSLLIAEVGGENVAPGAGLVASKFGIAWLCQKRRARGKPVFFDKKQSRKSVRSRGQRTTRSRTKRCLFPEQVRSEKV